MINPLSGRTREEEILIARGTGGRLPFDAYQSLLRRGKPRRVKTPRKKKKSA